MTATQSPTPAGPTLALALAASMAVLAALAGEAAAAIPPSERQALLDLYASTAGTGWTNTANWNGPAGTECTWFGVTCSSGQSSVQELRLGSNNLTGTLPASLGNLANLQFITVWLNHLTGPIPRELGSLTGLSNLDLSNNQLTGSIPSELGGLANLSGLILSANQLTGPIPASLGNLGQLGSLHLETNQLTGSIPVELGNLTQLRHLWLATNPLSGPIPGQLGNLINLQDLVLAFDQLTGPIPGSLGSLATLQTRSLANNQLTGSIPGELGNLTNLYYVYLQSNRLTGLIPASLGNLAHLVNLWLYSNQLSGPIPAALGNLANLRQLVLSSNQLMGVVPSELTHLTKLSARGSDFRWNGLYSSDPAVVAFLNGPQAGGDWQSTQTVPLTGLAVGAVTNSSVTLTWSPIAYTGDTGGYQVFSAMTPGGPYALATTTADKTTGAATITDLAPGTPYTFNVRSVTDPHAKNQSTLVSEPSGEVSATTLGHRVKLRRHLKRAS